MSITSKVIDSTYVAIGLATLIHAGIPDSFPEFANTHAGDVAKTFSTAIPIEGLKEPVEGFFKTAWEKPLTAPEIIKQAKQGKREVAFGTSFFAVGLEKLFNRKAKSIEKAVK